MYYDEQVRFLFEADSGFASAVKLLEKLGQRKRLRILHFSHHDTDGIASAFIMQRLLRHRFGAEVVVKMPIQFRLSEGDLVEALKGKVDFDLLLLTDKGTFSYYDDFFGKVGNVLIIDHHMLDGRPQKCTVFNPSSERSVPTAASLLCHMIATKFGSTSDHDDFVALMGCRGDFALDPVEKTCAEFARPFIERSMKKFPHFFKVRLGRPTMYDTVDRRRTALVNQIVEVVHAGSLAHFYEKDLDIRVSSGPELVYNYLMHLAERDVRPADFRNIDDLLGNVPKGNILASVLKRYRSDWDVLNGRVQSTTFLGELQGVGVYLFFAREVLPMQVAPFSAILPFVASTQLEPLKRAFGHKETMIVLFCPKERGIQISMRGGGEYIDCGAICFQLAERLRRLYPGHDGIEGGGHASAAECFADKPVPMYSVMQELISMIKELTELGKDDLEKLNFYIGNSKSGN
ncbi:MAG: DHH family phosphoesterase [Methanobacteriota archaeon]